MRRICFLAGLFLLTIAVNCHVIAQASESETTQKRSPELPLRLTDEEFNPLAQQHDVELQKALQEEINKNKKWKSLATRKKLAVAVVDLRDVQKPKFAGINSNEMMYAASLPKIAVLFAAMDAIDKGELKSTPEIQKDMRLMISKSNNQATTRMIDLLGYEKIEQVLTDEQYHLYQEDQGGGLWVGKRYASGGATNREPLKNLSHAATAYQVCRFYYMLVNGRLVSRERSKQMLDILESPELHHKFVNTLDQIAPVARVFRKSGSWKSFHSDSVLVWGKERRYILVALVEDESGEQIMRNLVIPVERAINR